MNDIIAFKSLYKTLIPVICWLVFSVAVYEASRNVKNKILRVVLAVFSAAGITLLTVFALFDRSLLAVLRARGTFFLPLSDGMMLEFLILWFVMGALLKVVQAKENPPVQRVAVGFIGSFFVVHFTLSAFVFFY